MKTLFYTYYDNCKDIIKNNLVEHLLFCLIT